MGLTVLVATFLGAISLGATSMGATVVADQKPTQIGPPQPVVTPDSIKADRERFEREYKLDTKRPWDGMYSTPAAPESTPAPETAPKVKQQ
jgi:hypothetical protein